MHVRKISGLLFANRECCSVWELVVREAESYAFVKPDDLLDVVQETDQFLSDFSGQVCSPRCSYQTA